MATLPRYENLGVQYAAVPKISTAPQEVMARGLDRLSSNIDRLTSYALTEREKQVKKEAAQYAVDNPITGEQLNAALQDPNALKVKGAGPVFQETYQAYAAAQLSADLQLQASTALKRIELQVENGQMDALEASVEMQDLLDGQTSFLRAVSPEYAVKHRAAVATMSATSRNKVYEFEQKRQVGFVKAELELNLQDFSRRVEDIIVQNIGVIDTKTGQPIDVSKMIANELTPFAESVTRLNGDDSYYKRALTAIDGAKVNSLAKYLSDRTVNPSASDMSEKFLTGDFGKFTPVFKSLDQEQKDKVYAQAAKSFVTEYTAKKNAQSLANDENKVRGKAIALRILDGNISGDEKRKLVRQMVGLDYITFQSGEEMLRPKDPPMNPRLEFDLLRKINRGDLTTDELIKESPNLSNSQFVSLGKALLNAEDAEAKRAFKAVAGIIEGQQVIGDSKIIIYGLLDQNYTELRKINNPDGTPKYTPAQAREEAIKKYHEDEGVRQKKEARDNAEANIREDLGDVAKDIPIDKINLDHPSIKSIPGMNTNKLDRIKKQQKKFIENMGG